MTTAPSELVLFAGCAAAVPFRDLVHAAASAGWDAISVWPLMYHRAQSREGHDPSSMRALLDDAGLRVTEVDACFDWLPLDPGAAPGREWGRDQFFEAAAVLGADTLVAAARMHTTAIDLDAATESFASLCDDADAHDMRVGLEFVAFSAIPDGSTAWQIVEGSGCSNGGLVVDVAHHFRSGNDEAGLDRVPAERIYTVQLADGPAAAPADLYEEARMHRVLPGEGDFDVAGLLERLVQRGVRARVGPEIYQAGWSQRSPELVAQDLMAATLRCVPADR